MIFPNKLISFSESILAKSINILLVVEDTNMSISEFLLAMDILYLLGKIKFDENTQVIEYVKSN